ncbi:L-histidine N(alpha)-methyltransferase [Aquaspirillum sp. LM1]|uniref:L-histidine N(alpha)-methyltransferase n=1 Tax=Aquaspirillum sp. LM1 TaxID=1938604 RepID=UPI001C0E6BFC|nr:L-histidine N(alpha)-methyltransferase [Aquaspirillum sp. LM1]
MACKKYGNAVYTHSVRTVAETAIFQRYASEVWSEAERVEFINWIAANPEAGDVIRGSGGCRKVRWSSAGQGKRGGARVIYFNASTQTIWLLIVYKKAKFDNLPTSFLVKLKQGVEDVI